MDNDLPEKQSQESGSNAVSDSTYKSKQAGLTPLTKYDAKVIKETGQAYFCPPLNPVAAHFSQARNRALYGCPLKVTPEATLIPMNDSNRLPLQQASGAVAPDCSVTIRALGAMAGAAGGAVVGNAGNAGSGGGNGGRGKAGDANEKEPLVKREPPITEEEAKLLKLRLLRNPHDLQLRAKADQLLRLLTAAVRGVVRAAPAAPSNLH